MNTLVQRAAGKLARLKLRFAGQRLGPVVSVSAANAAEIAARYEGVRVTTVLEAKGVSQLVPGHLPEDCSTTLRPFDIERETVLLDIINQEFSFRNFLVIDPELRTFFAETFTEQEVLRFRRYAPRVIRKIPGTVAYLSNTWVDNYYHWLQFALPLLRHYVDNFDYVYVGPSRLASVQEETLLRCGISPSRILRDPCRADRLLAAISLNRPQHDGMRYRDVWGHDFTKALFPSSGSRHGPKRIYVRRGSAPKRQLTNESAIMGCLAMQGFTSVTLEGWTVADQAELFSGADIIVGVHGAALTNLIFSRSGTSVLEILPSSLQEPGMFTAATHSNLNYWFVLGDRLDSEGNFSIAVPKLQRALDAMISKPP